MLLEVKELAKTVGAKNLFSGVSFSVAPGQKIALIGRNGNGKTTLLRILSGEDHDYDGKVTTQKGIRIILTQQEHIHDTEQSALEYILASVPHYHRYKDILNTYEQGQSDDVNRYLTTLEYFTEHNYFNIEDSILSTLADFGIANDNAQQPLARLSGGQKRYVEMTRMMFSRADLLLVDEPTNHMDYLGKNRFISWMKSCPQSIIVVTHDRDVLQQVDSILELKDHKMVFFNGNYDHFIAQNANATLTSVKLYSDQLNRLKEAKKKVEWGLQMRAKSKEWKTRYDHWLRDYEKLKAETVKPSFWIDQNSVESLDKKVVDSYHKFKQKNIKIAVTNAARPATNLLNVRNLTLGYDHPVCTDISFSVRRSDRVFIKGRNGAGKSTLVKTILAQAHNRPSAAVQLEGEIALGPDLRIGEYEQEIHPRYLNLPLAEAIRICFNEKGVPADANQMNSLMAQYLFHPIYDGSLQIGQLSGGQKARFQLIKMFIGQPNLLILDEPTNHLDLPSIEELENALAAFEGGILYITHDTYFIDKMQGSVVEL